jgi:hypothetical protein
MEHRNISLIYLLVFSPISFAASEDIENFSKNRAQLAVAAIMSGCVAYEMYAQYSQPLVEPSENDENFSAEEEMKSNALSFSERATYCAKAMGYGLLSAAAILGTYKSVLLALDRISADPIKERHGMFERNRWPKSGEDWERLLKQGYEERNSYRVAGALIGSLAFTIPYFAYYKYRFPHAAVENFRKAFQH